MRLGDAGFLQQQPEVELQGPRDRVLDRERTGCGDAGTAGGALPRKGLVVVCAVASAGPRTSIAKSSGSGFARFIASVFLRAGLRPAQIRSVTRVTSRRGAAWRMRQQLAHDQAARQVEHRQGRRLGVDVADRAFLDGLS